MSDRAVNFSRRRFLKSSAGVGFSVAIAANGAKVVAQESTPASSPVIAAFNEAPQLAEQVAAARFRQSLNGCRRIRLSSNRQKASVNTVVNGEQRWLAVVIPPGSVAPSAMTVFSAGMWTGTRHYRM